MAVSMKWNLGCGFDIKEGWFNTNHQSHSPVEGAVYLDALEFHIDMVNKFDYILVNHTLCVLTYEEAEKALCYAHHYLKESGVIEVIEMDLLKSFENYKNSDIEAFPGFTGSLDNRFCRHLVGYGRKAIYTTKLVEELLRSCGFNNIKGQAKSQYDLRPKESLIVGATK